MPNLITSTDVFIDGMSEEQLKAQEVFEAQLRFTAEMINRMTTTHRHYTDDCGDDLSAALDLSNDLQRARMDGPDALIERLTALAQPTEEDPDFREIDNNYSDVAPEVMAYINAINPPKDEE
jgi:hypothetical protein